MKPETQNCVLMESVCKICHKPMTVLVDKDYVDGELKAISQRENKTTRFALLPLSVHNKCIDVKQSREDAAWCMFKNCTILTEQKCDDERKQKIRERLTIAARQYAKAICNQLGRSDLVVPVDELVEQMMVEPSKVNLIVSKLQGGVRYAAAQQELII